MQRITEPTRETDPFGTGVVGYTDGDAVTLVPATELNADAFNNFQEEVARCVESDGATVVADGGTQNYFQLSDAVGGMSRMCCVDTERELGYVLGGLLFTATGASLNVTIGPGEFVYNGRRFVVTADMLDDTGFDAWTLIATRDVYFFVAPEDPGAPSVPPNQATVWITTVTVAVDAAAPASPNGEICFARLRTNGTGVLTGVSGYYNRGPSLVCDTQEGIRITPNPGSGLTLVGGIPAVVPFTASGAIDLGVLESQERSAADGGHFFSNICHASRILRRVPRSTGMHRAYKQELEPLHDTTVDATVSNTNIFDLADFPEGTFVKFHIEAVAFNETNADHSYSARREFIVYIAASGVATLNSSAPAGTPTAEHGTAAAAAGANMDINLTGTDSRTVRAAVTGINPETMRWVLYVTAYISTYEP